MGDINSKPIQISVVKVTKTTVFMADTQCVMCTTKLDCLLTRGMLGYFVHGTTWTHTYKIQLHNPNNVHIITICPHVYVFATLSHWFLAFTALMWQRDNMIRPMKRARPGNFLKNRVRVDSTGTAGMAVSLTQKLALTLTHWYIHKCVCTGICVCVEACACEYLRGYMYTRRTWINVNRMHVCQ